MSALASFRALVAARFGLRFDDDRPDFLAEVLERRAAARAVSIARYLSEFARDDAEARALGADLTVGETYFFRNIEQFEALRDGIQHDSRFAAGNAAPLRILSAGCSSGEEPFSLAMLFHSMDIHSRTVSIRALDLNPASLRRAEIGRYSEWSLRETPPDMLARWFRPRGRDVELDPLIRTAVEFECGNLADPSCAVWNSAPFDVIFCRNVIMYFTPEVQRSVVARLASVLVPGGHLFLGHAETLRGLSQEFHLVHTHDTFYYRRREVGEGPSAAPIVGHRPRRTTEPRAPAASPDVSPLETIKRATGRIENLAAEPTADSGSPPAAPSPHPAAADILDLLARERFAEALALLDQPSRMARGEDLDGLLLRAVLFVQSGDYAAAARISRSLIARDEHHAGANYLLGLCHEGTGAPAAALVHYDLATHIDPFFAMPFLRRGVLSRRSGQIAGARADLGKAHALLEAEDPSRLLIFGSGFTRGALLKLCEAELGAIEAAA